MKTKTVVCLLLALALPAFALAQSKLILPHSQEDLRKLMQKDDAGPCEKCGIVTDVRTETRQPGSPTTGLPAESGIGGNVATSPILGSGSVVKDAKNAQKPTTYYKMTVRFDDGTYAFFEQDDAPAMRKGDKVKLIEGRVERGPD